MKQLLKKTFILPKNPEILKKSCEFVEFEKWRAIHASVGGVLACEWRASVGDVGGMLAWVAWVECFMWRVSVSGVLAYVAWMECLRG